jgi:hypothetical protein
VFPSFTSLFHRSYNNLTARQQSQIDRGIERYLNHPGPPYPRGWRVHKLEGKKGTALKPGGTPPDVWEKHCPGPNALVITWQINDDGSILFRNCGLHDETIRNA